jgi:hypothetical protein
VDIGGYASAGGVACVNIYNKSLVIFFMAFLFNSCSVLLQLTEKETMNDLELC